MREAAPHGGPDPGPGGRGPGLAAALAGAGVLTMALVVLAASAGSVRPVSRSTAVRVADTEVPPPVPGPQTPTATETPLLPRNTGWTPPAWVADTIRLVVLSALLLGAFLLVRTLVRAVLGVLRDVRLPEPEATDPAGWQHVRREEVAQAVTSGADLIDSGTPSDAIIACWLGLERAAAGAGIARGAAETPAEFTVRVLAAYWVSRAALERLADLYREARFSEHGLPESARAEARDALALLRRELAPSSLPGPDPS